MFVPNLMAPLAMPAADEGVAADARFLARWILLGSSAGAVVGALVGGVGGRIAMFVLRLTSPEAVRGMKSDDGFVIGRFTTATLALVVLAGLLGSAVGLVYVAVRGFVPQSARVPVWTVTGAIVGGALLVHDDGVDFTRLEPAWLACTLFMAVPALGAWSIAWCVERWSDWWWRARGRTGAIAVPGVAAMFSPVTLLLALTVAGLLVVGRVRVVREGAHAQWGRALCHVGIAVVLVLGARDLIGSLRVLL
jgi:hypothetical protein